VTWGLLTPESPPVHTPTGSLTFKLRDYINNVTTTLGTASLSTISTGRADATLTVSSLIEPGPYELYFEYPGDAEFNAAFSVLGGVTIAKAPTVTTPLLDAGAPAVEKDPSGNVLDESYCRYYTSGSGSTPPGLMKYAFGGDAFDRLVAALGSGVDALSDAAVAPYAGKYLAYDSSGRVTAAVDAAAGCSACSGGLGTFSYAYTSNSGFDGTGDPNQWATKTVETLPDGNENVIYTNALGQTVLSVYEDTTTSQQWATYTRYNAAGQVVLVAQPSAVTGFGESYRDLVNYGRMTSYLSASAGLITTSTYATATTATTGSPGDVAGYLKETAIRHGPAAPRSSSRRRRTSRPRPGRSSRWRPRSTATTTGPAARPRRRPPPGRGAPRSRRR